MKSERKRVRAFRTQKVDSKIADEILENYTMEKEKELLEEIAKDKAKHSYYSCGRKKVITPKIQLLLLQAFSMGCTDKQARAYCAKNGHMVAESTFYDFLKENPDFKLRRDAAKQNPIMLAKGCVLNSLSNDPKLALDYLKLKCSNEFKEGIELSGTVVNTNVSIEDVRKMRDMLMSDEEDETHEDDRQEDN